MDIPDSSTHALSDILKDELLLITTYELVLAKAGNQNWNSGLRELLSEHREALQLLSGTIGDPTHLNVTPLTDSEKTIAIAAVAERPPGDPFALRFLRDREKKLVSSYERALHAGSMNLGTKELIRSDILPAARNRVAVLEGKMGAIPRVA